MITPVGLLLIPVGVTLLFGRRRHLFWATLMSMPFYHVTIVNLSFTRIKAFHWFAGLFILRRIIDFLCTSRSLRNLRITKTTSCMIGFLFVVYISIIMSSFLQGEVSVVSMDSSYVFYRPEPLSLSITNFSQCIYPTFMVMLYWSLLTEIKNFKIIRKSLILFIYLAIPIIATGLTFQLIMTFFGKHAVGSWFHFFSGSDSMELASIIDRTEAYKSLGGFPRMFSLAGEPGYTAYFLLFPLVILGGYQLQTSRLLKQNVTLFFVVLLGMILTGSTTAYLGIFTLVCSLTLVSLIFARNRIHRIRWSAALQILLLAILIISASLLISVIMNIDPTSYLRTEHLERLSPEEIPASIRGITIIYSLSEVFPKSPLLGVGYGAHRSTSLLVSMLCNVGMIGTVFFLGFNLIILKHALWTSRHAHYEQARTMATTLTVALLAIFPVMLIRAMVGILFGWYWFLLAVTEALYLWTKRAVRTESLTCCAGYQVKSDYAVHKE